MKKILNLSIVFFLVFYSMAINADANDRLENNTVCEKYIVDLKEQTVSVKCVFLKSKEHISTILSGTFTYNDYAKTETEEDLAGISLKKLLIMKNGKKSQEIEAEGGIRLYGFSGAVQLMDINFDGYDDIQLWTSTTAGANSGYEYWLYNPDSRQFDKVDLSEKLYGFDVTPDPKTKTISVKSHSGCCYNWERTFRWVGKELRKKTELYYGVLLDDSCGQIITHYNGKEEILSMDVEPSGYCKGDEHNEPMSLEPYLTQLKNEEKTGGYILKKRDAGKFTVVYKKPKKINNR